MITEMRLDSALDWAVSEDGMEQEDDQEEMDAGDLSLNTLSYKRPFIFFLRAFDALVAKMSETFFRAIDYGAIDKQCYG